MNERVLQVQGLCKNYDSICALQQVDFSLKAGEVVALLGPNGAGKSTLLQLLTGLFSADSGTVHIVGLDLRRQPAAALAHLGVVFQQPTLDLDLTIRGNLRFAALLQGLSLRLADEAMAEWAPWFDLEGQEQRRCRQLSGGNRRKVELLRALLHQPHLLLMDEATVGLDPPSRASLLRQVHRLAEERQLACLWATHLVDEAAQADRVLVLDRGRLVARGSPEELCRHSQCQDLEQAFFFYTRRSH